MVDIIVRRHGGSNPGDDIVDPLMATDAVAMVRGRNELDASAQGFTPVTLRVLQRPGLQPGQVVEVNDSHQGASYRAKVKRVTYRKEGVRGRAVLEVERVSEFQGAP